MKGRDSMSNAMDLIDIKSLLKIKREDKLDSIQSDVKILQSDIMRLDAKTTTMQSDIKILDAKVDNNFELLKSDVKRLDHKIDSNFEVLNTKIEVLNTKIDNVVSMKKWVVLMFITILLALAALIGPNIIALFN